MKKFFLVLLVFCNAFAFADLDSCKAQAEKDFETALKNCENGASDSKCTYFYQINKTVCGINCQYFYQTNEVKCPSRSDEVCNYFYQVNQVVCGRNCQYFYQTNEVRCVDAASFSLFGKGSKATNSDSQSRR